MQLFKLIKYFSYLAFNWNLPIAIHIIRNEIIGEKKYGLNTTGADELRSLQKKGIDITHATIYMPAGYDMLEAVFEEISKFDLKHIVDIGCGKGRAICVAASYNFTKLTGIDFSKELCLACEENLKNIAPNFPALNYKVINNDAFYFEIPADADCIFLFNPFDETIMSGVIQNIEKSLRKFPRKLFVIYLNPVFKKSFIEVGFTEIFHVQKLKYLEGIILSK